jgi:GT2 family glycosyltransferase
MSAAIAAGPGGLILCAVINWNGWRDTVTCVESLRAMSGPPVHLLICDNGSSNDSYEQLCAWARDAIGAGATQPPGARGLMTIFEPAGGQPAGALLSVRVMKLADNFGYAGAINRCIAWGRDALAPAAYWFLNNDIAVEPDALLHLVAAVRSRSDVGLCGSVLLEWDEPSRVQAIGGIFNWVLAVGRHLKVLPADVRPDEELFFGVDYPVGASLLATREFVQSVGFMDEDYFLYYEEMDWAERGRANGYRPAVALRSRIRHKEGASTGSMGGVRNKSLLSEYYSAVNRLRFTRKFSARLTPVVWLTLWLVIADRLLHREWKRAALIFRLTVNPRSVPRPR